MSNRRAIRIPLLWLVGFLVSSSIFPDSARPSSAPSREGAQPKVPGGLNTPNVPPSAFRQGAPPDEGAGIPRYIGDAKIQAVTPPMLRPAHQFMVDVTLTLNAPLKEAMLLSSLRVFVDAVEVQRVEPDKGGVDYGPPQTAIQRQEGVAPSNKVSVSLFAMTPKDLDPSQGHTVSVYSDLDRRALSTVNVAGVPAVLPSRKTDVTPPSAFNQWTAQYWAMASFFVLAVAAGVMVLALRRERKRANTLLDEERERNLRKEADLRSQLQAVPFGETASAAAALPGALPSPPSLPQPLFDQASAGSLSLVIGPGVSAQSGLPTSVGLWPAVLQECALELPKEQLGSLRKLLGDEGPDAMLEALVSLLGRKRVIKSLQSLLLNPKIGPSRLHQELAQLPIRACIDMTWDALSIEAFNIDPKDVYGPTRRVGFSTGYRSGARQLIKPFGSVADPSTVVLTDHEYRRQISELPELQRSIAALFSSQTLLFVGMSLKGIGQFLSSLPPELEGGSYTHYALIPRDGNSELWQAGLGRKFGVKIIEFSPSEDYHEVPDAVATLNASVRQGTPEEIADLTQASAKLRYVQLSAIGIFRELKLELADGWTLLLGNNGGGKSTILRAIALALSGNDSRLSALSARLLRSGESSGTIELGIGSGRILSTLVRDEKSVTVRSPQTTLLQSGQMLVLAFPALRGVITLQPQGPTVGAALNPSVDDVLPLLQGIVDSRLNNLQQWLVNAVLRSEKSANGRDARMLETFQSVISEMVPGGRIKYSRLDRTLWTVYFTIDGIEVPFDGISQGMSSILNWVGVLLQRLYDVYPNSKNPEGEPALVLIDEIDAHLHPMWQRQLVTLARKKFPKVQVVASSHSPLLAGAVRREELRIIERDAETGQMSAVTPREDLAGQKVEDILTSSLFSLPTTRSPDAEKDIHQFFTLFEKPAEALSVSEKVELENLGKRLQGLNYGPTRQQKKIDEEIKAGIDSQLKTLNPDAIAAMQDMLNGTQKPLNETKVTSE